MSGKGNKYGGYAPIVVSYHALAVQYVKTFKRKKMLELENEKEYILSLSLNAVETRKFAYVKEFRAFKPTSKEEVLLEYNVCRVLKYKWNCLRTNPQTKDKIGVGALNGLKPAFTPKDIYEHRAIIEFEYGRAFNPVEQYLILKNDDTTKVQEVPMEIDEPNIVQPKFSKIFDGSDGDNLAKVTESIKEKVRQGPITVITIGQTNKFDGALTMLTEIAAMIPNSEFTAVQWYMEQTQKNQNVETKLHDMNKEFRRKPDITPKDETKSFQFPPFNPNIEETETPSILGVFSGLKSKILGDAPAITYTQLEYREKECKNQPTFYPTSGLNAIQNKRFMRNGFSRSVVFITIYEVNEKDVVEDGKTIKKTIKTPRMSLVDLPGYGYDLKQKSDLTPLTPLNKNINLNEFRAIESVLEFFKLLCFNKQKKNTFEHLNTETLDAAITSVPQPLQKSTGNSYAQSFTSAKKTVENHPLIQLNTAQHNLYNLILALKLKCDYMLGIFNDPESQVVLFINSYHNFAPMPNTTNTILRSAETTFRWVQHLYDIRPAPSCPDGFDIEIQGGTKRGPGRRTKKNKFL